MRRVRRSEPSALISQEGLHTGARSQQTIAALRQPPRQSHCDSNRRIDCATQTIGQAADPGRMLLSCLHHLHNARVARIHGKLVCNDRERGVFVERTGDHLGARDFAHMERFACQERFIHCSRPRFNCPIHRTYFAREDDETVADSGASIPHKRSMAFTTLMLFQLFNSLSARSDSDSSFCNMFGNHWLWGSILLSHWTPNSCSPSSLSPARIRSSAKGTI